MSFFGGKIRFPKSKVSLYNNFMLLGIVSLWVGSLTKLPNWYRCLCETKSETSMFDQSLLWWKHQCHRFFSVFPIRSFKHDRCLRKLKKVKVAALSLQKKKHHKYKDFRRPPTGSQSKVWKTKSHWIGFPTWLITMFNKFRKDWVVGPLPHGLFMAYKWGWS